MENVKKKAHESAKFHVTGEAIYVDDMLVNQRLAHGHVVYSPHAHAIIKSFNLDKAKKVPGVYTVLSYKDIPGENNMGPVFHDEEVLSSGLVKCVGQAMFLIAASDEKTALEAADLIEVEYETLPAILRIQDAISGGELLQPERKIESGDINEGFQNSHSIIEGTLKTGAQEHWYLETQACLCIPGEGDEMLAYSSTQHPSETQALIAEVLGVQRTEVCVKVRRMGGAFGGKETQGNHTACWTALLAIHAKRPVKIRLFRDDDQKITGKRHPFLIDYKIGFNSDGLITAYEVILNQDGGCATDLSMAVLERAMFHAGNCYHIPNIRIIGKAWKLNLPSNTAFRGFGGPQGMAAIENAVDAIARKLKIDPETVRKRNFFGTNKNNNAPFGQEIKHNRIHRVWEELLDTSDYYNRKEKVKQFNSQNEYRKRGITITPVQFGISFTTSFLNQAGALINIYQDGTMLVNHGGTEMGQGLYTKIRQIAALEMGLKFSDVKVNSTDTSKVPNTSATAASAGTDLNGMAVKNGIDNLKERIIPVAQKVLLSSFPDLKKSVETGLENIVIREGMVCFQGDETSKVPFSEVAKACVFSQVSLSSTGYYKTPGIVYDREKGRGTPFYYFSFGAAVSEVEIDVLTGHVSLLRTDLLHDVGESLNPRIDIGQVEGGFVQGLGWCTTEECKWNDKGQLLNHSPDTYKIPNIQDIPKEFNTSLLQNSPHIGVIRRSKAVAEPPFMLSFSVWLAIKEAISATRNHELEPIFHLPATNELILLSLEELKSRKA